MRLWEAKSGTPLAIFRQFDDEVLDCTFSLNGKLVAGCSADGAAKVFSVTTKSELGDLEGHDDAEVSRVQFSPSGNRLITVSGDKTLKIWDARTGFLIQTLQGHTDDIFAASFSYDGETIITASKDNTC